MDNEVVKLQGQIDELKKIVDRLQSGGSQYCNMSTRLRKIRNKAFEDYFGTVKEYRNGQSKIQIDPRHRAWSDYDYLRDGMTKLINIMYKHSAGYKTETQISSAVKTEKDVEIYQEIADYIVSCMVEKLQEIKQRRAEMEAEECTL